MQRLFAILSVSIVLVSQSRCGPNAGDGTRTEGGTPKTQDREPAPGVNSKDKSTNGPLRNATPSKAVKTTTVLTGGWLLHNKPLLKPDTGEAWDSGSVFQPSIVHFGNEWRMYYIGSSWSKNGLETGIGFATSRDGMTWIRATKSPLLRPRQPRRAIANTNEYRRMNVTAGPDATHLMLIEQADFSNDSYRILLFQSKDGRQWGRHPTLPEPDVQQPWKASQSKHPGGKHAQIYFPWVDYDPQTRTVQVWFLTIVGRRLYLGLLPAAGPGKWGIPQFVELGQAVPLSSVRRLGVARESNRLLLWYGSTETTGRLSLKFLTSVTGKTWKTARVPKLELVDTSQRLSGRAKDRIIAGMMVIGVDGTRQLVFDRRIGSVSRIIQCATLQLSR